MDWKNELFQLVQKKPIAFLRFSGDVWQSIVNSKRSANEFTIALPHSQLDRIKTPNICIVYGEVNDQKQMYFGIISSRSPVTTLQSRIKVKRSVKILPHSVSELAQLINEQPHAGNLARRIERQETLVMLSSKLSSHLLQKLLSVGNNSVVIRSIAETLLTSNRFTGLATLQQDALRTALQAFGITFYDRAQSLELFEGKETTLARVSIMEDSVIQHDARYIPKHDLVGSDITGRAVFRNRTSGERLEVYTANRLPLEHCFGVDLIYYNESKKNIVMLQYKMLEPSSSNGNTDWIYRPDKKLHQQLSQMKQFNEKLTEKSNEYRLNSNISFIKFVKRNASIRNGSIVLPIEHFERLLKTPMSHGPQGGLRVSYDSLSGRYLRQNTFLDLLSSGYIGSQSETTSHMKILIDAVLNSNKAVVAAIQQQKMIDR